MTISVIIPTYNRAGLLPRAIGSVLSQTSPADEVIVADDGSNDNTAEILAAYGGQLQIIRQGNRGVSAARNAGIRAAKGDWIALLDSDDAWLPRKLENQRAFIRKNPGLRIFQSAERWIRNGKHVNPKKKHAKPSGWIFEPSLKLCLISPSAVIFQKSLWEEMGGFDESLPVCEDYDLWLRIAKKYPVGLDKNESVLKYGGHADQLSTTTPLMDVYRIRAMEKHLADKTLKPEWRKALLRELLFKTDVLISGGQKRGRDVAEWIARRERYTSFLDS